MEETARAKILNVDDDEAGRYSVTRILEQAGFEVIEAATGAEALKLAMKIPDLVLLDVNLPDMHGFEVCRRLKSDPATCAIPVLHISATFLDSKFTVTGLEGGADGYLTQPVEPPVLLAHIKALIRSSRLEKRLARTNRSLRALSNCNQALLHAESELDLVREACRTLVEVAGHRFVWVGSREPDPEKSVLPIAKWGEDEGFLELGKASWDETGEGYCPMGEAIRTGKPFLLQDIRTDSRCEPWRSEALKRGFVSAYALPLIIGRDVWGAISICSDTTGTFDDEERELLWELAQDLSYGIESLRTREEAMRAQEALRESEGRYRSLFDESRDAIYLTARDGTLVEANQAFLDLFGFTTEEARDMNILKVYREPADRPRFQERIERYGSLKDYEVKFQKKDGTLLDANQAYFDLLGGEKEERLGHSVLQAYADPADRPLYLEVLAAKGFVRDYSLRLVGKDGRQIDCLISSRVERDKDGNILSSRGFLRDITEQKNLQRQLLQAQKMEAIGTLTGGIAHDFNNILTVVMGFSELLLAEKEQGDGEYADLQKIFHAAKNGADLVKRLLMFSRKSEPKPVPMNLNKQIVQVEKLLRRTIPKMIDVKLELSADLPDINADLSQVEQVLMNLAVNGRDAMPDKGKLTLRTDIVTLDEDYCRLHVEANPGEYVLLEISDTGHGMDKETVAHIFEPFFTTKEMGKGTGLGLAMVYGVVKQHNGHITVYSEVGKGTTFRVYLPAIPSDVEPEVEDSGIMPAFGTETVLLVDDEELVSDLGARILTKHGYTVLKAANGREALDLFKKERSLISLVILDLIMPEMGGRECLKELLKTDPQVNVLVASGYSADASVKETIQMGAKGFVTKPFRVKELLRSVRRVLDSD